MLLQVDNKTRIIAYLLNTQSHTRSALVIYDGSVGFYEAHVHAKLLACGPGVLTFPRCLLGIPGESGKASERIRSVFCVSGPITRRRAQSAIASS
jgi:hypothetical protein